MSPTRLQLEDCLFRPLGLFYLPTTLVGEHFLQKRYENHMDYNECTSQCLNRTQSISPTTLETVCSDLKAHSPTLFKYVSEGLLTIPQGNVIPWWSRVWRFPNLNEEKTTANQDASVFACIIV
jgi:hypothetical protein